VLLVRYRFVLAFTLTVMLLCASGLSVLAALPTADAKVPVIVGFKSASDQALVRAHGGEIKYVYSYVHAIAVSLPSQAIEALKSNPNVAYIEPDFQMEAVGKPVKPTPSATPTPTPKPQPAQVTPWGVDKISAPTVWPSDTGSGIKVAVVDTGIDTSHSDLKIAGGATFVFLTRSYNDDNGHGTHCAGIIAAQNNGVGVVGVAPDVSLYAVKVLNRQGSGYISDICAGIEWCITNKMQVISMSLGSSTSASTLEQECAKAAGSGIVLVAAAGNSGPGADTVGYPAHYSSVIAVGATDSNDVIAYFSSTGPSVSVAAPGVSIYSTYKGNTYATMSGTSMACPHVSGTVALMLQKGVLPGNVRNQLQLSAQDLGITGFDNLYGHGRIDVAEACTP
jgi:subtilisin family serine protease